MIAPPRAPPRGMRSPRPARSATSARPRPHPIGVHNRPADRRSQRERPRLVRATRRAEAHHHCGPAGARAGGVAPCPIVPVGFDAWTSRSSGAPAQRGSAWRSASLAAGHHVTIGSRVAERAAQAVERATRAARAATFRSTVPPTRTAVVGAEVVVVTVPFAGRSRSTARSRQRCGRARSCSMPRARSMTAVGGRPWQAHPSLARLGGRAGGRLSECRTASRWWPGFHTIAAHALADLERPVESDALLCADDEDGEGDGSASWSTRSRACDGSTAGAAGQRRAHRAADRAGHQRSTAATR